MATRIKLRRDTASNWLEQNPILAQGETGFETDTRAMKLGDGATRWADLKYAVTGDLKVTDDTIHGDTSVSLSSGIGNRENWIIITNPNTGDVNSPTDAYVNGVAYDSQGNVFTMGTYSGTYGSYLQKVSASGELLWAQYYAEYSSYGFGMSVDNNDDVIVIMGESDSTSDDINLIKISGETGSIVWQKYLNSYGDHNDYASCIDTDHQGNIFITGNSNNAGPSNNNAAYVAKFSGANGGIIWSKQYDVDGFNSSGTGLSVDKDGNIGVVGSSYNGGPGQFVNMFKIDGVTGQIVWQGKILNIKHDNGNTTSDDVHFAGIQSSDVTSDSLGNFYLTSNWYHPSYPSVVAFVAKFNATTGKTEWAQQLTFEDFNQGSGSVICDELNNVYVSSTLVKHTQKQDAGNWSRPTQQITKINATGSIVWQRWLSKEQGNTIDGKLTFVSDAMGQSIRVNKDYIVVSGNEYVVASYSNDNQYWYTQPYVAQLSRDGTEFEVSGWRFIDSSKEIQTTFISLIEDADNYTYDPANVTDFNFTVANANVTYEMSTDTADLYYINKSNVNRVTFSEKTLTLPKGGVLDVAREQLGYIAAIGHVDGPEGWNASGAVWLNGNDRDDAGATYSAGGWYSYNTWNNWSSYRTVPVVFKTDANGKLIWSAGNALDQDYSSPDLVDVVYDATTNTVVTLGNDGELDGHEGFNISYLDADTGSMKQAITHIRPAQNENDIWPTTLSVMTDGSPVVGGYITSARATYANVTVDGAGLTGSTNDGTLVVLKSKFTIDTVTEYPKEDGTWYLYPGAANIVSVNRYGHDEAYPDIAYTGTLGSAATVDITIAGANITAAAINAGGSGYKPGQKLIVPGTVLGGVSPDNDIAVYVNTVDGSGAITALADSYDTGILVDGTYTGVSTTAVAGTGIQGWVQYAPEGNSYTLFNIDNGGQNYGVGDTFKILGTALGGTTPANDLTITVTAINGTGHGNGQVTTVSLEGTPQSTNIKLYGGSYDYTQAGQYNIVHELANDGFIWTPTWSKVFGSTGTYSYDDFHGLTLDTSDNVIVSGYSEGTGLNSSTTWYGSYNQTGVITKFSSVGEILWSKSIDGSEGASTVWGVATDMDDNIYSVMTSSNANDDPYITKLTPDGDYVWQQSIAVNNSYAWAIDVADNGDVMIAGQCRINEFNNDYHRYRDNILVVKFDKDGNLLFSRVLWSMNGLSMNNRDNYSNQLTIKNGRFSIAAYSYDPGDYDCQGITIDLPLDGTGAGDHGAFYYEELEVNRSFRFENNYAGPHNIVTDITSQISARPHEFVSAPYEGENAWRNTTIYADRTTQAYTIYKPAGGEVKGVAKITFEDGSVQTSSQQGLPQIPRSRHYNRDYWLRPEDNGKHILQDSNRAVIIPERTRVDLPVGFAFTIINKSSNTGVYSENDDESIYLSGDSGNNYTSYTIPQWTMATIVKMESGYWMIAGAGVTSGW